MKPLLAMLLCALPLLGPRADPASPPPTDDPPVECPLCGGNVRLHALVVGALSAANAEACRRVLVALGV